jgi:hypothetical protein
MGTGLIRISDGSIVTIGFANGTGMAKAFSSEVDTGSREENAIKQ